MRLTDNEFHTKENKERACYIQEPRLQAIYDKLFDLEDIEEELGIDLLTLIKALKNPIYVKELNETIWCSNRLYGGLNGYFMAIGKDTILYLQDYGKTWALTKEELL